MGDAVSQLGRRGFDIISNNGIVKRIGETLDTEAINSVLNQAGELAAPIVNQIKDAIRTKLNEVQDAVRQLGDDAARGADHVIEAVTGQPRLVPEGGNLNQIGNQPMQSRGAGGNNTYKTPEVVTELNQIPNADLFAPNQLEHVLFGNQSGGGRFTGWHHFPSRLPDQMVRVKNFGADGLVKDSNGVYQAIVEASFDGGKTWVEKTARNHTFFPNEWSKEQVVDEIASAFKEGRIQNAPDEPTRFFRGISKSGVEIRGYTDSNGQINTAFPIFGQ